MYRLPPCRERHTRWTRREATEPDLDFIDVGVDRRSKWGIFVMRCGPHTVWIMARAPCCDGEPDPGVHQENPESDSAQLEALGNVETTCMKRNSIEALGSASDIDSRFEARGRN